MRTLPFLLAAALCACDAAPARTLAPAEPEGPATEERARPGPERVLAFLLARYDRDGDGRIRRDEYARSQETFAHLDADGDGCIDAADFDARFDGRPRRADFRYGEGGPEEGDPAPDFELGTLEGGRVALRDYRGKRPVALVFGSFT